MFLETFAATSVWLASTQAAPPSWCAPARPPVIHVGLVAPRPTSDFSKTMKDLKKFHIDTKNPYGAHVDTHVGGLTAGTIKVEQKMTLGGARKGDYGCLWVDDVHVTVRLDQRVYIAKDYAPGTCLHNAVWDHEHKHVRVDREMINAYRPVFETALRNAAVVRMVHGPVAVGSVTATQDKMMDQLRQVVAQVTAQMEAERDKRQGAVDTRAEYDRVSALCKGR
jgi:hypothetical protein